MDNKEFKTALETLCKEKGISEDVIYDAMELALTSAYKKNYHSLSNVRVDINRETGDIKIYSYKTVVFSKEYEKADGVLEKEIVTDEDGNEKEVEKEFHYDDRIHITLEDARKQVPGIQIGETIEKEVTPKDFGRVAAATAKQVVVQKIREAEREIINNEFADKQDEMITGLVAMEDVRNYYIDLGRTQGILPKNEIIPGETIKMGSSIKVYITKVENNSKGPLILLSRKHYGFVKRLFELEIPEINEGIILIYSVARDAGNRTKIAVYSENPNVDPVGSCIGEHGSRINRIIEELNGEKIKDNEKIMKQTAKIPEGGLRATIYSKLCLMDKLKIKYNLNISRDVRTTDLIDLDEDLVLKICKILGVFLDNAIEAVKELNKKEISIEMYTIDNQLCIDITNNFKGTLDLDKITNIKYTTKGDGHGYGLTLVNRLLEEEETKLENEKSIHRDTFTQTLKIKM